MENKRDRIVSHTRTQRSAASLSLGDISQHVQIKSRLHRGRAYYVLAGQLTRYLINWVEPVNFRGGGFFAKRGERREERERGEEDG